MILLFSWCPFEVLETNLRKASALFHEHETSLLHWCFHFYTSYHCRHCSGKACSHLLCIPGRDACRMISPGNQRTPLQRNRFSSFAQAHLPLLTPGRWAWVKSARFCLKWGSCMNRYEHQIVSLPCWYKASVENVVKYFCQGNFISVFFILLEMLSYPSEILLGQVLKSCSVGQGYPCMW